MAIGAIMKPTQTQIEAEDDARLSGLGFIKTLPDGTQERIDPRTIYMTTPTQAQIEAVAKLLKDALPDTLSFDGSARLAERALAAAHEAWLSETFSDRWQAAKDRAAAAEAGEQRQEGMAWIAHEAKVRTIERCAQVAEGFMHPNSSYTDAARQIAAAIRALKDQNNVR